MRSVLPVPKGIVILALAFESWLIVAVVAQAVMFAWVMIN